MAKMVKQPPQTAEKSLNPLKNQQKQPEHHQTSGKRHRSSRETTETAQKIPQQIKNGRKTALTKQHHPKQLSNIPARVFTAFLVGVLGALGAPGLLGRHLEVHVPEAALPPPLAVPGDLDAGVVGVAADTDVCPRLGYEGCEG